MIAVLLQIQQRILLLAGENDLLIPSSEEARRLSRKLPRCNTKVLPGRSHALLQEAGVDLVQIIQDEGFYVTERRLSNVPAAMHQDAAARNATATKGSSPAPSNLATGIHSTPASAYVQAHGDSASGTGISGATVGGLEAESHDNSQHSDGNRGGPSNGSHKSLDRKRRSVGANFGTAAPLELPTKQV